MENPLTEEQVKQLQAIAQLPPEQQQEQLPAFLKTLSPEQIAFLKKQQAQGGCPFCHIVEKKIPAKILYEDDAVLAVLDIRPATKGHTLVMPKRHISVLGQLEDKEVAHLFTVANKLASKLYETLKAEGTNIFVANGPAAGQTIDHFLLHVIPRYKDDGVQLVWKGKEVTEEELTNLHAQLTGTVSEQPATEEPPKEEQQEPAEQPPASEKPSVPDEERMPDF